MKDALAYEQISDDLMLLDPMSAELRFNVRLLSSAPNGSAEVFHKEYKYDSKYSNRSTGYSIRRNFTYFLSINPLKTFTDKMPLMITIYDMLLFKAYLSNAYKWITTENIYAIKNNKLILKGQFDPLVMSTIYSKTISFEPIVLRKSNDIQTQGIRMKIDTSWIIDIDANRFAGLLYLVDSIDMYTAAITLINYFPSVDFGSNITKDFSSPMQQNEIDRRNDINMEDLVSKPLKQKKKANTNTIYDL